MQLFSVRAHEQLLSLRQKGGCMPLCGCAGLPEYLLVDFLYGGVR